MFAHYDPSKRSVVAADACQDGLGAVLFQTDSSGNRRAIAFASRSLNDTEKRYAVIEKEALAAAWACEKFNDYILGTEFTLETDHRPLVPLLSSTDLSTPTKDPPFPPKKGQILAGGEVRPWCTSKHSRCLVPSTDKRANSERLEPC